MKVAIEIEVSTNREAADEGVRLMAKGRADAAPLSLEEGGMTSAAVISWLAGFYFEQARQSCERHGGDPESASDRLAAAAHMVNNATHTIANLIMVELGREGALARRGPWS